MPSRQTPLSVSCSSGGSFYACGEGSRFIGCCRSNPCSVGCPAGNLVPSSFDATQFGTFSDQECSAGQFFTCIYPQQNNATFLGCCKSNACSQGKCPQSDLSGAFLSQNSALAQPFLQLNTTYSARTTSTTYSSSTATSTATSKTSTSTPSSTTSVGVQDGNKSTTNIGAIVGGVLGGVIVLLLIAILVFWQRRRRHNSSLSERSYGGGWWPFSHKSDFSPSVQQSLFSRTTKSEHETGFVSPDVRLSPYLSQEPSYAHHYGEAHADPAYDLRSQASGSPLSWQNTTKAEKPRMSEVYEMPGIDRLVELDAERLPSKARPGFEREDTSTVVKS